LTKKTKGLKKLKVNGLVIKIAGFVGVFGLVLLPLLIIDDSPTPPNSDVLTQNVNGLDLSFDHSIFLIKPSYEDIITANNEKIALDEQARLQKIRDDKLSKLLSLLSRNKSPVATMDYANQILDYSEQNDADYRIIVAIMGVESGFCKVPTRKNGASTYNCFGYLNGVAYSSFSDAFKNLIPKIAKQYANKYGWDFESLAKAYGQIGWEETSRNMRNFANQL
jgi:hypothetical protein